MGFGKPAQVTPLNEQLAVELGADILAEMFLFAIAAGGLTAEYIRYELLGFLFVFGYRGAMQGRISG